MSTGLDSTGLASTGLGDADQILPLVRRWAVSWINGHDPSVCTELLAPDYQLRIGTFEVDTRDGYVEATLGQLQQFPGLVLTVHGVLTNGTQAALWFTEHGASLRHGARAAAWVGVVLFEGDGTRLTRAWAEEDYAARKRQLASGVPDPVAGPAVAPWDTVPEPADPAAEAVVRAWVEAGLPPVPGVVHDDAAHDDAGPALSGDGGEVDVIMSAGRRVAFHARVTASASPEVSIRVAGLVRVRDGAVRDGVVVTDRLAARSELKRAAAP